VEHLTILGRTFEYLTDTGTVADKTYVSKKLRSRFENYAQDYGIFLCIDTIGVAFTDSVGEQVGCLAGWIRIFWSVGSAYRVQNTNRISVYFAVNVLWVNFLEPCAFEMPSPADPQLEPT
jgi:hypothetical protein